MNEYLFTSEAVMEGSADKACDYIADSVVDAYLAQDPDSHVDCEVMYKGDFMAVAGEVKSLTSIDVVQIARRAIHELGYTSDWARYNDRTVVIHNHLTEQSRQIAAVETNPAGAPQKKGANDQGIMFGYATAETAELMPLPIKLAQDICQFIDSARHHSVNWLRPDGKATVTVRYVDGFPAEAVAVTVACQHSPEVDHDQVESWVREAVIPQVLGEWVSPSLSVRVNVLGDFLQGGPEIDTGMTGRKLVVDTYGGMGRIGGGALSGKDPFKLDRAGAYYTRWIAKNIVARGIAKKAELQVAYGFAQSQALSVWVNTFGTGDQEMAEEFARGFDYSPYGIGRALDLATPIYRQTARYGHFGKQGFPWEELMAP